LIVALQLTEGIPMMKTRRLYPIVAFIVFATISLPQSSYAQPKVVATGIWAGTEYFSNYYYLDTTLLYATSGSNDQASLTLQFYDLPFDTSMSLSGFLSSNRFGVTTTEFRTFNSQQAIGQTFGSYYHQGSFIGNFDVTYQSDFANGIIDTIDTNGGYAVADATIVDDTNPFAGNYVVSFVSFESSSVPEPSSLVLAAAGLLTALVFAWARGFFGRSHKPAIGRRSPL
jgi:hypothetical protein